MKRTAQSVGTISLSGAVIVSDPCYHADIWCNKHLAVKPGTWHCFVERTVGEGWDDNRTSRLILRHENYKGTKASTCVGAIGVDSGQAGVFDEPYFRKYASGDGDDNPLHEGWYKRVMEVSSVGATLDNAGLVSESGYGDGYYAIYAGYSTAGEIVALTVKFI